MVGGSVSSLELTENFALTSKVGAYVSLDNDLTLLFYGGISITDSSEDSIVHVSGP